MLTLRPKRRTRPCVEAIEPRDSPAALALGGVLGAARTAMLAYKVGQLAYTGHTNLLFGAVRVSQPFALRNIGTGGRSRVAPVSIGRTPPSGSFAPAGEREADADRDGQSAGHGHGRRHHHHMHDRGHHRGWDHAGTKHHRGGGHGGDHGD